MPTGFLCLNNRRNNLLIDIPLLAASRNNMDVIIAGTKYTA